MSETGRPTPEQFLEQIEREERYLRRGRFGYAAGTGKTYRMLEEGHRLKEQGVDVVIGYVEQHGRKDTIARAYGLESLLEVCVSPSGDLARLSSEERRNAAQHLRFARELRLETRIIQGENTAVRWWTLPASESDPDVYGPRCIAAAAGFRKNLLFEVLRLAPDIQITVVAQRRANRGQ